MNRWIFGILLIIVGVFLIFNYSLNWNLELWPLALLIPGIFFLFGASRENNGLYIPGTILTFLAIFFFFNVATNWSYQKYLWPLYVFSVSLAFYITAIVGKESSFFVPANILLIITVGLFFISLNLLKFWPIALIILGLWIIFDSKNFKRTAKSEDKNE
ncbi:MAG: hypothetical protein GYA61_06625 [Spirochaetales bacterium]|jgi:predicted membrane protein|nr:hypothetical protein [Exilispira sp.]NMC67882.1 hypothetical protein [Spirochaetales bacterium]